MSYLNERFEDYINTNIDKPNRKKAEYVTVGCYYTYDGLIIVGVIIRFEDKLYYKFTPNSFIESILNHTDGIIWTLEIIKSVIKKNSVTTFDDIRKMLSHKYAVLKISKELRNVMINDDNVDEALDRLYNIHIQEDSFKGEN